jgi:hypothetical protein
MNSIEQLLDEVQLLMSWDTTRTAPGLCGGSRRMMCVRLLNSGPAA